MEWNKKGLIFRPDSRFKWMKTHAALPTPMHLRDSIYRIYFSSRDKDNQAHISFFDYDFRVEKLLYRHTEPVLWPGLKGHFDGQGVQATSVNRIEDKVYLYYLGWQRGAPNPLFYTSIGLAISEDNGTTFNKYSRAPILERSEYDPWMVSGGTVIKKRDKYLMYYLSGQHMEIERNETKSFYDIKIARSNDGINWTRDGTTALKLQDKESNISRMSILKINGKYSAWYPTKKKPFDYRIGYAESTDAVTWNRFDERVGIGVSSSGWDSLALDKVAVLQHREKLFMLYNGNRFGYDGIGLATSRMDSK